MFDIIEGLGYLLFCIVCPIICLSFGIIILIGSIKLLFTSIIDVMMNGIDTKLSLKNKLEFIKDNVIYEVIPYIISCIIGIMLIVFAYGALA